MSQVRLTLRPPPNVDFVDGYPGIPAGPNRPTAMVKGAVEVRVPPQGVKAKWVRIELNKIESLPRGEGASPSPSNTFADFVGESPVTLWSNSGSDDYGILHSADFPFEIRIPENLPPSMQLEGKAGIRYELVARVCVKAKRGLFFRSRKPQIEAERTLIMIDKHDLHSIWPIYNQPDRRQMNQDGVELTVERTQTCYGPGARVAVQATVKSDSLHTVILRGFELTLKETIVFKAGNPTRSKKGGPQTKSTAICETKLPVNATLYGGGQHSAELSCLIAPRHTTASVQSARYIDITYTLLVKALMGTGTHLIMTLPVMVTNWEPHISLEALRRIGNVPHLTLVSGSTATPFPRPGLDASSHAATVPHAVSSSRIQGADSRTVGAHPYGIEKPDEFGMRRGGSATSQADGSTTGPAAAPTHHANNSNGSNVAGGERAASPPSAEPTRRRSGDRRPNSAHRFTITNALPSEIPEAVEPVSPSTWKLETAEQEKMRLYNEAQAKVVMKQQGIERMGSPPPLVVTVSPTHSPDPAPKPKPTAQTTHDWKTAEEEKLALYNSAQAKVMRTQGVDSYSPKPVAAPTRIASPKPQANGRAGALAGSSGAGHSRSNSYAVQSRDPERDAGGRDVGASTSRVITPPPANGSVVKAASALARAGGLKPLDIPPRAATTSPKPPIVPYMTAEQEKAALRRYQEATAAVARTQGISEELTDYADTTPLSYATTTPTPTSYEALFPPTDTAPSDQPPSFEHATSMSSNIITGQAILSEKERLRRESEDRDRQRAAAAAVAAVAASNENHDLPPSFDEIAGSSHVPPKGLSEKEIVRRRFEEQDRRIQAAPSPPPRTGSTASTRPPPKPPSTSNMHVLTAAEEKAMLRSKFAVEDQVAGGDGGGGAAPGGPSTTSDDPSPPSSSSTANEPTTPPPLMPRPPKEYIMETQEEDARVSKIANVTQFDVYTQDEWREQPNGGWIR